MTKRECFSRLLNCTFGHTILHALRPSLPRSLKILAYHRVMDVDPDTYPFDISLVSSSPAEFEWQIRYLMRHYTIVSFEEVVRHVRGEARLPRNPLIVTFDDGYNDNYHVVFPLAQRLGFRFTVFLSTGFIDSGEPFWFDRLAFVFMDPRIDCVALSSGDRYELSGERTDRYRQYQACVHRLKYLPNAERLRLLNEIVETHSTSEADAEALRMSRPLTWRQIDEMERGGVSFGGHGDLHSILTTMERREAEQEIGRTMHRLKERLRSTIIPFSYPNGLAMDFDADIQRMVERAGFDCAVSYIPGSNELSGLRDALYSLRRIHVDRDEPRHLFKSKLLFPSRIV